MTDRDLMQVALHALEEITGWQSLAPGYVLEEADEAKNSLRERLARPEQEPVAWISKDRSEVSIMVSEYMIAQGFEPLYTAPPEFVNWAAFDRFYGNKLKLKEKSE